MTSLTPAMRQYMAVKKSHPDCMVFFRMGDFYEMFFEDARVAAKALNIALTSRSKDKEEPMCGIPYHALETYLAKMVNSGYKVAICEQMEDPRQAKGVVKREVVRIVTPGTLTEDYLLDEKKANLLAAVCGGEKGNGLAVCDLSTGFFAVSEFHGARAGERLLDELCRLMPREIILNESDAHLVPALKNGGFAFERLDGLAFDQSEASRRLKEHFGVSTLEGYGLNGRDSAVSAAGAVLYYIGKNLPEGLGSIRSMKWRGTEDVMEMDGATLRNLEIVENLSNGGKDGTLLEVLDRTQTAMGGRLLREWLVMPLKSAPAILERQRLVTAFFENQQIRGKLRQLLGRMGDFERGISRIAGRGFGPRDFSGLLSSISLMPDIEGLLRRIGENVEVGRIIAGWDNLVELRDLLERSVNPGHPATFKDTGFIKSGYSAELDELMEFRDSSVETIRRLEEKEREEMGIPSLKIGYNRIYGYYIEVTKKHTDKISERYIRKQSLVNCERYISPELKDVEEKLVTAEERAKRLEGELIDDLRLKVLAFLDRVRVAALAVARLDVSSSLADGAAIYDYCAPEIVEGCDLMLNDCRHPVIERLMTEENFVPNDVAMNDTARLMVITGPNMAGKSTYLRQVAIVFLMAQMGGYVAARSAIIGVTDRIFTRVGAQDRLQKGLSTFMVEMVETANILNNATERSLVILDEIGRGTSTFDGISIAWAVAEHLARLKARTFFATHYHELTDLAATQEGVENYNVSAREYHDRLIFMRKVEKGAADKSYGIQVARLAGLPPGLLKRAKGILRQLEKMEFGADGRPALRTEGEEEELQTSLFDARNHPVLNALRETDINRMTPLEAMNFLDRLRSLLD